jgi:hypothetical protein
MKTRLKFVEFKFYGKDLFLVFEDTFYSRKKVYHFINCDTPQVDIYNEIKHGCAERHFKELVINCLRHTMREKTNTLAPDDPTVSVLLSIFNKLIY